MHPPAGKSYAVWLSSSQPAPLSVCKPFIFSPGEPPPLYVQETAGKDRWTLAQGIGPKTLEMDRSRSGRLYKPALSSILGAASATQYTPCVSRRASEHALMISTVEGALSHLAAPEVRGTPRDAPLIPKC